MSKEEIYDIEIAPLMRQIVEICQRHKIAMLADFAISREDHGPFHVLTALLAEEYEPTQTQLVALKFLNGEAHV